jgi:predicted MPP superfamily phosphohydrolase
MPSQTARRFMPSLKQGDLVLKAWPVVGITLIQALLFLPHWFIYHIWIESRIVLHPAAASELRIATVLLSLSFIFAALLGFRFSGWLVALVYKIAAVWLGLLNFLFMAACLCWLSWYGLRMAGMIANKPLIADVLFGLAVLTSVYGVLNAYWIRVQRITVSMAAPAWQGRTAVMLSDLHLGNVNGIAFSRRIAALVAGLKPDIVFIPGDFFDGVKADPVRLAAPFGQLRPPFGTYFVTGNHEEYGGAEHYTRALAGAGAQMLAGSKVVVEGLAIAGISYGDSTYPMRVRSILEGLKLEPGQPAILLNHVPNRLPIAEQAGVTLQLSGHTHGGQLFPFTWFTRRAFGKFTYGLRRFGPMLVYTSSGAGTWGPPMRVGTRPEVVVITFE